MTFHSPGGFGGSAGFDMQFMQTDPFNQPPHYSVQQDNLDFGAADSNRIILAMFGMNAGVTSSTGLTTPISIGGVTGVAAAYSGEMVSGAARAFCAIYYAVVPTGTTGSLIYNIGGSGRSGTAWCSIHRLLGSGSSPSQTESVKNDSNPASITLPTLTVPAGATVFATSMGYGGPVPSGMTGVTSYLENDSSDGRPAITFASKTAWYSTTVDIVASYSYATTPAGSAACIAAVFDPA
jgi:hypothetical protein